MYKIISYLILLIVACGVLASLGFWQISRGDQKKAIVNSLQEKAKSPRTDIRDYFDKSNGSDSILWSNVVAEGQYSDIHIFLDNRVSNKKVGYEVFVPFFEKSGLFFLVRIGFAPALSKRTLLPEPPLKVDSSHLEGYLGPPPTSGLKLGNDISFEGFPREYYRVQNINTAYISERLKMDLQPFILYLGDSVSKLKEIEGTSGPHKHYAYAVQWFAMSFVLAILGFISLIGYMKRYRNEKTKK